MEYDLKHFFLSVIFSLFLSPAAICQTYNHHSAAMSMRPAESMVNPSAVGIYNGFELEFQQLNYDLDDPDTTSDSLSLGSKIFPGFYGFIRWESNQGTFNSIQFQKKKCVW